MALTTEEKKRLLDSAKDIFRTYLVLEKSSSFHFNVDGEKKTILNLLHEHASDLNVDDKKQVIINNGNYEIIRLPDVVDDNNNVVAQFSFIKIDADDKPKESKLRYTGEYDENSQNEMLDVFCNQPLGFKLDKIGENPYAAVQMNGKHVMLGGPDKIELYASHLNVIKNIIDHLSNDTLTPEMQNNILIALPTGSGKTMIQAIWFLILYNARIGGVFSLPGNLSKQFIRDFSRLLPNEIVNKILPLDVKIPRIKQPNKIDDKGKEEVSDESPSSEQAQQVETVTVQSMVASSKQEPVYFIGSHQEVLCDHFKVFEQAQNMVVSIDEVHKAVEIEAQKIAAQRFSEDKPTIYLTATPSQRTYELCGEPVAVMSNKAKKEAGQGDFSHVHVLAAKDANDYRVESNSGKPIIAAIANGLSECASSTAASIVTEVLYLVEEKDVVNEHHPRKDRWNFVPVLSRKALVCAGENVDDLINLYRFSHPEVPPETTIRVFCNENNIDRLKNNNDIKPNTYVLIKNFVPDEGSLNTGCYVCELYYVNSNGEWLEYDPQDEIHDAEKLMTALAGKRDASSIEIAAKRVLFGAKGSPELLSSLYVDGNYRNRNDAYSMLRQKSTYNDKDGVVDVSITRNLDEEFAREYLKNKDNEYVEKIPEAITKTSKTDLKGKVIPPCLNETLDNTIFHSVLEVLIRGVLAYHPDEQIALSQFNKINSIDLNDKRCHHLSGLVSEFSEALTKIENDGVNYADYFLKLLAYNEKTNKTGIDYAGAKQVSSILEKMLNKVLKDKNADRPLVDIVDNAGTDYLLKDAFAIANNNLKKELESFSRENRTMYIMSGMADKETPIDEGRPFRGFKETVIRLKDKNGNENEHAKKRTLAPNEFLNPDAEEVKFTPDYCDEAVTEEIADNYFQLGLTGMLISNRKSEGFSDRNLQTVISLVPANGDRNNKPSQIIQQLGRNRGLDPTQIPSFIQCYGKEAKPAFDATLPERTDRYYPQYFAAEREYKKTLIRKLGVDAADEVAAWYKASLDSREEIDPVLFRWRVIRTVLEKMRTLNNCNDHKLMQTKEEFRETLAVARDELQKKIDKMKDPFTLPAMVRRVGAALSISVFFSRLFDVLTNIRFWWKSLGDKSALAKAEAGDEKTDLAVKVAYANAVRNYSLRDIFQNGKVVNQIAIAVGRKKKILESVLSEEPQIVLNDETIASINDIVKLSILPMLVKLFPADKQSMMLEKARELNDWHYFLNENKELLDSMQNDESPADKMGELAKVFFSHVPELSFAVLNYQPNDFFSIINATLEGDLEKIASDHTLLYASYADYFKNKFTGQLSQFLPVFYLNIIDNVLSNDKNAADFAKNFTDHMIQLEENNQLDLVNQNYIFNMFREQFNEQYPDLNQIGPLEDLEQTVRAESKSVGADIKAIFNKYVHESAAIVEPDEQVKPSGFLDRLKSGVKKVVGGGASLLEKAKMAAQFLTSKKEISNDLALYFNTKFLYKLRRVLPDNEYRAFEAIFGNKDNCNIFANYLVGRAPELAKNDDVDLDTCIDMLRDCFKGQAFVNHLELVRSPDEIKADAVKTTDYIEIDIKAIADAYKKQKPAELATRLSAYFQGAHFTHTISKVLSVIRIEPDDKLESTEEIVKRLMLRDNPPNAQSFATLLTNDYASLIETGSENQIEKDVFFLNRFIAHFSTVSPGETYDINYLHLMAKAGFSELAKINDDVLSHIDRRKLANITVSCFADIVFCEENSNAMQFYLDGLKDTDIAAILYNHDKVNKKDELKPLDSYLQPARDMLRFYGMLDNNQFKKIVHEYFFVPAGPHPKIPNDQVMEYVENQLESIGLVNIMSNFQKLVSQVTNWSCYYYKTTPTGGPYARSNDKMKDTGDDIYSIRIENDDSSSFLSSNTVDFLQAQNLSAEAAGAVSALANKTAIKDMERANNKLIQPFEENYRPVSLFRRIINAINSVFSAIRNFFVSTKPTYKQLVKEADASLARDIGQETCKRKPLTLEKLNKYIDKRKQDNTKDVPQDALEKVIRKVDDSKIVKVSSVSLFNNEPVVNEPVADQAPKPEVNVLSTALDRHGLFVNQKSDTNAKMAMFKQSIPDGFELGISKDKGDCFFDACAQQLNEVFGKDKYTDKSLRVMCHQYAVELDKRCNHNPDHPDNWIGKAFKDNVRYQQYMANIQYTDKERKDGEGLGDDKLAIWGEQHIDGRIISEVLGVQLHVIEVKTIPDDKSKLMVAHNLVTHGALRNVDGDGINWQDKKTIHLGICDYHYVPISSNRANDHALSDRRLT